MSFQDTVEGAVSIPSISAVSHMIVLAFPERFVAIQKDTLVWHRYRNRFG